MNHCYTFPVTLFQGLCLVRLLLVCILPFCILPFCLLQFCLLLFHLLNVFTIFSCKSTQLKFNVQFNVLWNILLVVHTYIQVYNFLIRTQLLSALIYLSKQYSFENFSWIVFLPEHLSCPSKNFDFGICTSFDVSGCSLKEYPEKFVPQRNAGICIIFVHHVMSVQYFNKDKQNLGKSKFNNNAANRSRNVE